MNLSDENREVLIDLVANKLDTIEIFDRDDRRVIKTLQSCLSELTQTGGRAAFG